ncbi:translocation/assembly module TamB domain-containing protein [Marivirga salinae]|uniref:Translocation/assembly module TamB domain-containing protein n=1 Tax=Marivirga salinarum TaxID=3059078 RepID=A0AA51NBL2_9BACT|nr:translocation/assembly module TamB domain-containing protein [Marivirga sp. BDSF4-3]WMN12274.1 translocation/assembly module TamB domain-containing protein [Marivirga sp. BDSF4-3]
MKKTGKIILYILGGILLLLVTFILSLRLPVVQQKITNYATKYVSEKTQTKFEIKRLYITFLGAAQIEGLYAEDTNQDTLIYANSILADVAWKPLLDGNVDVKNLELNGITGRVHNNSADSSYNFQFIIDAFANADSTSTEKETDTTSSTTINVRQILLENIDLSFQDINVEMNTNLKLGELELSLNTFDLDSMHFDIEEFILQNVKANYSQGLAFPPSEEDSTESTLPKINVQKLSLNEIDLKYETFFDSLQMSSLINLLEIRNAKVDLAKNKIELDNFDNKISHFRMRLPIASDSTQEEGEDNPAPFEFPDYNIKLNTFNFDLANLEIKSTSKIKETEGFNPDDMQFQDIKLNLKNAKYITEDLGVENLIFSARDSKNFELKELSGAINFNATSAEFYNLKVETTNSILQTDAIIDFSSIDSLFAGSFYKSKFRVDLKLPTTLNIKDAFYFSPKLKEDSSLLALSKHTAKLYGKINGNDKDINLQQFRLLYGNKTSVALNAKLNNWQDGEKLMASFENLELKSNVSDFRYFMPKDYPEYYPHKVYLSGSGKYNAGNIKADLSATLDDISLVKVKGNFNSNEPESYQANIKLSDLELAKWLQDSLSFNTADLDIVINGKGLQPEKMNTQAAISIRNFSYMANPFDTINMSASLVKSQLEFSTNYSDSIVDFNLDASGNIDSIHQKINLNADIKMLDLLALNISDSAVWASTKAIVNFEMDSLHQSFRARLTETNFTSPNKSIYFTPLALQAYNSEDSASVKLTWENIAFDLNMNHAFDKLAFADLEASKLQKAKIFEVDTTNKPMRLSFSLKAEESHNLLNFLPLDINFKPINAKGNYNSSEEIVDFKLSVPQFQYQDINLDSLNLSINNSEEEFHVNTNFQRITSGSLSIYPTILKADITPERALFNFFAEDSQADSLFHVDAIAERRQDSLFWSLKPDNLILNAKDWNMHPENRIYFDTATLQIQNMIFERNMQLFEVKTALENNITSLQLNFENFRLENFFAIINAEESPAKGIIKGGIKLDNLQNLMAFSASLKIDSLNIFNEEVGNLSLNAEQESVNRYGFNISSKGEVSFRSKGWFDNNPEVPEFDFELDMDSVSLPFLTSFSDGLIKEASGNLAGHFNFSGNTEDFVYDGRLNFQEASLFFPYLNMTYQLPDEVINLKNEVIKLNNFTLLDEQNSKMQLNGTVTTKNLLNPKFDLRLTAENFQLLNSTKDESDLFFGKAFFNADISWKGSLDQPTVQAKVGLNEKTDLTYVIPETRIDVVEQEGIVTFTKPYEASDTIASSEGELKRSADIDGMELNAIINTDKNAKFKVIVDEKRGDYLTVSGDTDLNLTMRKNGAISLNGNVEVNKGYYQLSLYDLVKRRFEIQQGSRISWSGDPYEATLDITALYKTETPVNTLMEDQISSASSQVQTQYRQKLPFYVQLFVGGNLSKPEISFGLDMPEASRGALGGNIYQQVQSINTNETRLNKQVFSLLVLNQFFPSGSSNGGPNSEAIARNSASQILSNQLNKLSSQYVKGVNLNLDLNSYEDYQSGTAQDRTQLEMSLSKNLFNDRFRVEVGSQVDLEGQQRSQQQATDIIGNIMVEYLLTEDGRYKLRGFRKSEYEGFIDGQVVITGVSIQFSKEFEKFNELWQKTEEDEE